MIRFFVLFLVMLAVLFGLALTSRVQAWFVVRWTNTLGGVTTTIVTEFAGKRIVREPVEERLGAARRKAMMLCFARAAALRLQLHLDPGCGFEI